MAYENLSVELMVPREPEVAERLHGFYEEIGWLAEDDPASPYDTYVSPRLQDGAEEPPQISYWQTTDPAKCAQFWPNKLGYPTEFARGLSLPILHNLVEVTLVVPSDEEVLRLFEAGGKILQAHAHVAPREHVGRQEFRLTDPFNYALRVTSPRRATARA